MGAMLSLGEKMFNIWNETKRKMNAWEIPFTEDKPKVNRVEVIDKDWRSYVNLNASNVKVSYQDWRKTLKIFID
jgi:hypothetical protein